MSMYDECPLVSIVTPMYNCERYIARCLDSIIRQKYENIEAWVVDDGSTDSSASIVRKYAERDDRIKYIYQNNSGPGTARNRAIAEAKGKYILFVDSDDYIGNDYIGDLVECAEKNDSELVIAGFTLVYENGKKQKAIVPKRYIKNEAEEWAYRISACCSRLYQKAFWDKNELEFHQEREARAEDVPIVLYSNAMAKNIAIIQNAEYFYYQHGNSAMNNKNGRVIFTFPYDAFSKMLNNLRSQKMLNGVAFWRVGILKFLTQFDLGIYRRASKSEKERLESYIAGIIFDDWDVYITSWKQVKKNFTFIYKFSIGVFLIKYTFIRKRVGNERY